MYETFAISEEEASFRRNMDLLFGRMRSLERENEKLAVDSVMLDKIIVVVKAYQHNLFSGRHPDMMIREIATIIDEGGD